MNSTHVRDRLDPLNPKIETDDLALPLEPIPLPTEIFHPPPTRITSAQLQRLHKLAAIAPPAVGSKDEVEMLQGLEGLLGLMDQVKNVELDNELVPDAQDSNGPHLRKEAIRKLLASGNYADPNDIFDGSRIEEDPPAQDELPGHEAVVGKDLLAWRSRPMER
jgi:Asp-tRNA(Asn)/Glu-tRNA(Gln) amidotransferase C subunit